MVLWPHTLAKLCHFKVETDLSGERKSNKFLFNTPRYPLGEVYEEVYYKNRRSSNAIDPRCRSDL